MPIYGEYCACCGDFCPEDEMQDYAGRPYCDDCIGEVADDPWMRFKHCPACGKMRREIGFVERLRGWVCAECAHIEEVTTLGYCDRLCDLCKYNSYIACEVEHNLTERAKVAGAA